MPPEHLVLKKETRMLGAVQVMIGLINGALGRIWLRFYIRQFEELSVEYKPIALLSGYPFWTFLFFIVSGVLTIQTEKKRSPNLVLDTRSSFYYILKNGTIRASVQSEKV
ncbi:membrane-spanning 4-domains subfamily A member 8 [Bubalus bubalis]|uniref:membrane-spanning 4-domains subfamily A member 8 n=1 Tax=Bubalus bubalis TaxID=89462 RepID=UPI001D118626|nr:membrane-spanning 4-domains subfamily A member 8 [Bubalus bubalis]